MSTKYLKEAALNGNEEAQYDYAMKMMAIKNTVEGLAWLLEASSIANSDADRALYDLYLDGSADGVVKPKPEKALMYADRLKEAGYPDVQPLYDELKERLAKAEAEKNQPKK